MGRAGTLGHVWASRRAGHSEGSDTAGRFPTMAACRVGPGRSPRCMSCTTAKRASRSRQPLAVRPVGSSACPVCRSAGSGTGTLRWVRRAEPCSRCRAAASRSSASTRRASLVRSGRHHRWSGRAAREACPRAGPSHPRIIRLHRCTGCGMPARSKQIAVPGLQCRQPARLREMKTSVAHASRATHLLWPRWVRLMARP